MTNFEFVFSLFGLLLGLSLAEVLGGFARALKRHGRKKIGLLTPMLSIFLLYDISTFWITAWRMRDSVPIHIGALVLGLIVTGLYYFATVLVWPEDGDPAWDGLDDWMLAHKRQVLLSVFVCNAVSVGCAEAIAPQSFRFDPLQYVLISLYFGMLLAGAFVRGRRMTGAVLGVLLGLYALDLFVNVTGG